MIIPLFDCQIVTVLGCYLAILPLAVTENFDIQKASGYF